MPPSTKKQRLLSDAPRRRSQRVACRPDASFDDLSNEVLPNILGFLDLRDIMSARTCCKTMRDATKKAIVGPYTYLVVDSVDKNRAMAAMTEWLPNLPRIFLHDLGHEHKYIDGEDPDERRAAETVNWAEHEVGIISNFRKLRTLVIGRPNSFLNGNHKEDFNGTYPALFNFPQLEVLGINDCRYLKVDLAMFSGLPMLRHLSCDTSFSLRGSLSSLRVLKGTLEYVKINENYRVEGNFMDLADFPHLKTLDLSDTTVTGDIRDIGKNDFPNLYELRLPDTVYGGDGYEFQRISDVPAFMNSLLRIKTRVKTLFDRYVWRLSRTSPDWYDWHDDQIPPPFCVKIVTGPRLGWCWHGEALRDICCEINWLDPKPERNCSDYKAYIRNVRDMNKYSNIEFYKGYYIPPTEEEYNRLIEEASTDEDSDD